MKASASAFFIGIIVALASLTPLVHALTCSPSNNCWADVSLANCNLPDFATCSVRRINELYLKNVDVSTMGTFAAYNATIINWTIEDSRIDDCGAGGLVLAIDGTGMTRNVSLTLKNFTTACTAGSVFKITVNSTSNEAVFLDLNILDSNLTANKVDIEVQISTYNQGSYFNIINSHIWGSVRVNVSDMSVKIVNSMITDNDPNRASLFLAAMQRQQVDANSSWGKQAFTLNADITNSTINVGIVHLAGEDMKINFLDSTVNSPWTLNPTFWIWNQIYTNDGGSSTGGSGGSHHGSGSGNRGNPCHPTPTNPCPGNLLSFTRCSINDVHLDVIPNTNLNPNKNFGLSFTNSTWFGGPITVLHQTFDTSVGPGFNQIGMQFNFDSSMTNFQPSKTNITQFYMSLGDPHSQYCFNTLTDPQSGSNYHNFNNVNVNIVDTVMNSTGTKSTIFWSPQNASFPGPCPISGDFYITIRRSLILPRVDVSHFWYSTGSLWLDFDTQMMYPLPPEIANADVNYTVALSTMTNAGPVSFMANEAQVQVVNVQNRGFTFVCEDGQCATASANKMHYKLQDVHYIVAVGNSLPCGSQGCYIDAQGQVVFNNTGTPIQLYIPPVSNQLEVGIQIQDNASLTGNFRVGHVLNVGKSIQNFRMEMGSNSLFYSSKVTIGVSFAGDFLVNAQGSTFRSTNFILDPSMGPSPRPMHDQSWIGFSLKQSTILNDAADTFWKGFVEDRMDASCTGYGFYMQLEDSHATIVRTVPTNQAMLFYKTQRNYVQNETIYDFELHGSRVNGSLSQLVLFDGAQIENPAGQMFVAITESFVDLWCSPSFGLVYGAFVEGTLSNNSIIYFNNTNFNWYCDRPGQNHYFSIGATPQIVGFQNSVINMSSTNSIDINLIAPWTGNRDGTFLFMTRGSNITFSNTQANAASVVMLRMERFGGSTLPINLNNITVAVSDSMFVLDGNGDTNGFLKVSSLSDTPAPMVVNFQASNTKVRVTAGKPNSMASAFVSQINQVQITEHVQVTGVDFKVTCTHCDGASMWTHISGQFPNHALYEISGNSVFSFMGSDTNWYSVLQFNNPFGTVEYNVNSAQFSHNTFNESGNIAGFLVTCQNVTAKLGPNLDAEMGALKKTNSVDAPQLNFFMMNSGTGNIVFDTDHIYLGATYAQLYSESGDSVHDVYVEVRSSNIYVTTEFPYTPVDHFVETLVFNQQGVNGFVLAKDSYLETKGVNGSAISSPRQTLNVTNIFDNCRMNVMCFGEQCITGVVLMDTLQYNQSNRVVIGPNSNVQLQATGAMITGAILVHAGDGCDSARSSFSIVDSVINSTTTYPAVGMSPVTINALFAQVASLESPGSSTELPCLDWSAKSSTYIATSPYTLPQRFHIMQQQNCSSGNVEIKLMNITVPHPTTLFRTGGLDSALFANNSVTFDLPDGSPSRILECTGSGGTGDCPNVTAISKNDFNNVVGDLVLVPNDANSALTPKPHVLLNCDMVNGTLYKPTFPSVNLVFAVNNAGCDMTTTTQPPATSTTSTTTFATGTPPPTTSTPLFTTSTAFTLPNSTTIATTIIVTTSTVATLPPTPLPTFAPPSTLVPIRHNLTIRAPDVVAAQQVADQGSVSVTATVTATSVVSSPSASLATLASRVGMIQKIASCELELGDPLPFYVNPSGLAIDLGVPDVQYHLGAIIANIGIALGFGIISFTYAVLHSALTKRDGERIGMCGISFRSLGAARFPGSLVFPYMFFIENFIASSLMVIVYGNNGTALIGVFVILICIGIACFLSQGLLNKQSFLSTYRTTTDIELEKKLEERENEAKGIKAKEEEKGCGEKIGEWFDNNIEGKKGEWFDIPADSEKLDYDARAKIPMNKLEHIEGHTHFVRRYGAAFDHYGGGFQWFIILEICASVLLGLCDAMAKVIGCGTVTYMLLAVFSLYVIAVVFVRPFSSRKDLVFVGIITGLQFAGVVMTVLPDSAMDSDQRETNVILVSSTALFVGTVQAGLDLLVDGTRYIYDKLHPEENIHHAMHHEHDVPLVEARAAGSATAFVASAHSNDVGYGMGRRESSVPMGGILRVPGDAPADLPLASNNINNNGSGGWNGTVQRNVTDSASAGAKTPPALPGLEQKKKYAKEEMDEL